MTIIAATDFSPAADNAVRTAAQLARKLRDSLLLVRVLEPVVEVHPELRVPESSAFDAALREASESELRKAVRAVEQDGLEVWGRTVVGNPAQVLAQEASTMGARLIVMGLRRHNALARLMMGSVAERTVLAAPCPVLLVPPDTAPLADWTAGTRPLRALVGVDLDSATAAVLEQIARLRQAGPCDATFVHTYWPPAEYSRLGRGEGVLATPFTTDPQIVSVLERELRARITLPMGPGTNTLRIESAWGPIGDALVLDSRAENADLLVIGTQQPHGFDRVRHGSSAIGTLRASSTAVLCVPAVSTQEAWAAKTPSIPIVKAVLCATDLSDLGNAAIPHAYGLLRGTGGVVELCHVHVRPLPTTPLYPVVDTALTTAEREQLESRLRALIPAEAAGLAIATRVTVSDAGEAATGILQTARRLGADAIVVASHGRGGLARTLLGSVAEAVLRGSETPVFVVRARRA
jgi:nucleotide-binding universal stress UspA family protein